MKRIIIIVCLVLLLISCDNHNRITQSGYIINLNSNIVHKTNCQTVPKMSIRNKVFSSKSIEDILGEGYVACKDCKPDRDALYIINKEINEFERILHDEFGFGQEYTDKLLKCLSNLYEGISIQMHNNYSSTVEYHKLIASCVYQNKRTWALIGGLYSSERDVKSRIKDKFSSLKITDKSYFNEDAINNLYVAIKKQHDVSSNNMNDFAHMSATIAVYTHNSPFKYIAGRVSKKYNGISKIEVQSGFIGDVCGTNGAKPSMNIEDYAADLDAVNLYKRYISEKDKSIYSVFIDYYRGLERNDINRAKEFLVNIPIEMIYYYRAVYLDYLLDENGFMYNINSEDYINRKNYYDNFVAHLINGEQIFTPCKYYNYNEY